MKMIYVFYVYTLECGHKMTTDGTMVVGASTFCPECGALTRVKSVERHQQEIDDIEELPG